MADTNNNEEQQQSKAKELIYSSAGSQVVDPNSFLLPTMGDYYLGAIDDTYLKKINAQIEGKDESKLTEEDAKKAAYYTEEPPYLELGSFNGVNCVDATISVTQDDIDIGLTTGDTICINVNSLTGDKDGTTVNNIKKKLETEEAKVEHFEFNLLGIEALQPPKWCLETNIDKSALPTVVKQVSEIKNDASYVYVKGLHDNSETLTFIRVGNSWREIIDNPNDTKSFRWCLFGGCDEYEKAQKAANKIKDLIDKAGGKVRLIIDNLPANKISTKVNYPSSYFQEQVDLEQFLLNYIDNTTKPYNVPYACGYYRCKVEPTTLMTGSAYVKINGNWINLAKAALCDEETGSKFNTEYVGTHSDIFNLNRYDPTNYYYADAFFKTAESLDDRKKIQQEIFGLDFTNLRKWTVTIGDITLFVPPTNITVVSTTENKSMPLLRAKGSMSKSGYRTNRTLNISIYFNEARGINGYEYITKTPNGDKITYHLNSLRALISQFKFTPFLPIENEYINETLGIDAIVVTNLSISNVPGYPKTIRAEFTCREFDYSTYIPEIFNTDVAQDRYCNFFSLAFNWATMRYYYQRPLINGNEIQKQNYEFNSFEFNREVLKNRTLLIPMEFLDPSIEFYIADESCLDEMLAAKTEMTKMAKQNIKIDNKEKENFKNISFINKAIQSAASNYVFQSELELLNSMNISSTVINMGVKYPVLDSGHILEQGIEADVLTHLNNALDVIKTELQKVNNNTSSNIVSSIRFCSYKEKINDGNYKAYYGLTVVLDAEELEEVAKDSAKYLNLPEDEILQNDTIIIPISVNIHKNDDSTYEFEKGSFTLDTNIPDMQMLAFASQYNAHENADYNVANYLDVSDLKFRKYNTGLVRIKSYSVSLSNHISNINLKDVSGSAPQYLGGEDTMISLVIETTNEETIRTLSLLPQLSAMYARKYHSVLPCWTLKVDSEITKFLGVFEVMIENVRTTIDSSSMPVHTLVMDLRSVDRTYRNREALRRLSTLDNSGELYTEQYQNTQLRNYFQIQSILAKAELYPDLELPTIEEMKKVGYEFIRYKFQDERVYVDPDFYFIYPNTLSSQIIREALINSGQATKDMETVFKDSTGAEITVKQEAKKGYIVTSENEIAQNQSKLAKEKLDAKYKQQAKDTPENLIKKNNGFSAQEQVGGLQNKWTICKEIKAAFLEENYKKEYDAYIDKCRMLQVNPDFYVDNDTLPVDTITNPINTNQTNNASSTNNDIDSNSNNNVTSTQANNTYADNKDNASNTNNANTDNQTNNANDTTNKNVSFVEGKYVYASLANARKASNEIEYYLSNVYINETVNDTLYADSEDVTDLKENVDSTVDVVSATNISGATATLPENEQTQLKKVWYENSMIEDTQNRISNVVKKFLSDEPIQNIFNLLNIDISDNFISIVCDMFYAAACGCTGEKEYSNKEKSTNWRPNPSFIGIKVNTVQDISGTEVITSKSVLTRSTQGLTEKEIKAIKAEEEKRKSEAKIESIDDGVQNAIQFGMYGIKQYTREEYAKLTKENVVNPWNTNDTVNTSRYLIDPYYRYNTVETIETYKKGCITNPEYATAAFFRIVLYWLKRLIDIQAIPNIVTDILRKSTKNEILIEQIQSQNGVTPTGSMNLIQYADFFNKNIYAIDAGKIWTAIVLALTDGSEDILNRINARHYDGLNGYIQGCAQTGSSIDTQDKQSLAIRKTILALIGLKRITDFDAIGVNQNDPASHFKRKIMEQIYIESAEDPTIFIPHSCHDMIVNDARGRMLRAFPTFYMMFIDEGRQIGKWKLHDNFYNNMSIIDMQIVKSRKLAADTATITMSNFYQSFTTNGTDTNNLEPANFDDVVTSIFSPRAEFEKEEEKLKNQNVGATIRLRAGARIHIRMGYGSNANMLPVVFNGVIAEANALDAVQIIAQGDGIELMNSIMEDDEAHNIKKQDSVPILHSWDNKDTPKSIMNSILTTHGGMLADYFKDGVFDEGYFAGLINTNPYGIAHFGDKDYTTIIKSGEPTQNIFEAGSKPAWGDENSITNQYESDDVPYITFEVLNKTVWDIANICRSTTPDYICAVTPFDFRSTLFIGAPRYYYAYSYSMENGTVQEKRKPFQQYHLYTSHCDIISNGITASSRDMKTVALGLYEIAESLNIKCQKRVGPIYADADIFPEFQKSMVVDTQLYGKGLPIVGFFTNTLTNDLMDNVITTESRNHENIAWRMTASALKDSMKDMYCGDLVILGDPSIKPHDRMYVDDAYTGITGQCLAKEVVHSFSINQGFITTVSPDLIGVVDDPYEIAIQNTFSGSCQIACAGIGVISYLTICKLIGRAITIDDVKNIMLPKQIREYMKTPTAIKATTAAARTAKSISTAMQGIKGLKGLASLGQAGLALAGRAALGMLSCTGFGLGFALLGTYATLTLKRYMKNLQAMQIFPLKRYGIPMTAGVEGSQGFVYGSPSYYKQGMMTQLCSTLFGPSDSELGGFVKGIFIDEEIQQIAAKNQRDLAITDFEDTNSRSEKQFTGFMKGIIKTQQDFPTDYRTMQLTQLATSQKAQTIAYNKYAILDTDKFQNSPKLKNNNFISEDNRIKPYIDEQFFQIIHEVPALNKGKRVQTQTLIINGRERYVKSIIYATKKNKYIYDIAMLNPNAINILFEILRRTKNLMPSANSSDPYEDYETTKKSFVILKSALRVGDTDTRAATGFLFVLEGQGSTIEPLKNATKSFYQELKDEAQNNSLYNPNLFEYKEYTDTNEISYSIWMPAEINSGTIEEQKETPTSEDEKAIQAQKEAQS